MKRTVKYILWLFCILAALTVSLVISFLVWRINLAHKVDSELQAIHAAGLPTNSAELNDWYPKVPDSENAALVMTQAIALVHDFPDARSNELAEFKIPFRSEELSGEKKKLLVSCLQMDAPALAKMREAIKLPKSRYAIDFSQGANYSLPHLGPLKQLARMEEFEALLALDSKNFATADASTENILAISRTLDNEPSIISWTVRNSMVSMATTMLERRLNLDTPSAQELTKLAVEFSLSEKTNLLTRALIAHRASAIPYFRMTRAEISGDTGISSNQQPLSFRINGVFERDLLFYLRGMETNIALTSLPPPQSFATITNEGSYTEAKRRHYEASEMFLPELGSSVILEAKTLAASRLAITAIAIEQFRAATGRLPENLATLTPKFLASVPPDPFDGQPLRYRHLAKGYVIYSIGKDRHDDGGQEKPRNFHSDNETGFDITFTVER